MLRFRGWRRRQWQSPSAGSGLERVGVEDVGSASGEEGEVRAKDVVDATTQDSEDGEGGVEGSVGIISGGDVHLPTSPHPGEGVEHAWTT